MLVSVVTFANLGRKKNLKTTDILPVIDILSKRKELVQVICQINTGFPVPQTTQAVPSAIRYPLRAIEKIFRIPFSRRTMERIFDRFAAWRLKSADIVVLHGGYTMPRTAKRARELGAITVDLAVSADILTNAALEREESALLGIRSDDGVYVKLARELGSGTPADYVIAMSEFAKESYVQQGFPQERIFIAAPDIDTARFVPRESGAAEPFRFLYIADTQLLKGLHYLLDAWKSLALPDAELLIVGRDYLSPETERRYEAEIAQLKNSRRLPHTQDIERLYAQSSVLVFPSLTEGFGRVTLEAMACGLPVITTENARGIVEDGKTGFVVPIRDAQVLADKMRYLYDHRDVAVQMGKDARLAVERKKPFGDAVYEICQTIMQREKQV